MSITANLDTLLSHGPVRIANPHFDADELLRFCQQNADLAVEREASGDVILMSPTNSQTGLFSLRIASQLDRWSGEQGGYAFDSSTGFTLPNGAMRSPDASWVSAPRWEALSEDERNSFAPLCPDFVVELMSKSDNLSEAMAKMSEYVANGAQLGMLVNRKDRRVIVYRPNRDPEELVNPAEVSGEPVLPGFSLSLARIF